MTYGTGVLTFIVDKKESCGTGETIIWLVDASVADCGTGHAEIVLTEVFVRTTVETLTIHEVLTAATGETFFVLVASFAICARFTSFSGAVMFEEPGITLENALDFKIIVVVIIGTSSASVDAFVETSSARVMTGCTFSVVMIFKLSGLAFHFAHTLSTLDLEIIFRFTFFALESSCTFLTIFIT